MFDKGGFVKEYSFLSLTRKKKENIVFIKKEGIFNTLQNGSSWCRLYNCSLCVDFPQHSPFCQIGKKLEPSTLKIPQ